MKGLLTGALGAILACAVGTSFAHHTGAGFDRTRTVTLQGTLKEFRWTNPHSWMEIDVPDDKGGDMVWSLEMTAPAILARAGWKSNIVKPGDKVSVVVRPLKSGEPGGLFVSITLPNGTVLGQAPPRPAAAAATSAP